MCIYLKHVYGMGCVVGDLNKVKVSWESSSAAAAASSSSSSSSSSHLLGWKTSTYWSYQPAPIFSYYTLIHLPVGPNGFPRIWIWPFDGAELLTSVAKTDSLIPGVPNSLDGVPIHHINLKFLFSNTVNIRKPNNEPPTFSHFLWIDHDPRGKFGYGFSIGFTAVCHTNYKNTPLMWNSMFVPQMT